MMWQCSGTARGGFVSLRPFESCGMACMVTTRCKPRGLLRGRSLDCVYRGRVRQRLFSVMVLWMVLLCDTRSFLTTTWLVRGETSHDLAAPLTDMDMMQCHTCLYCMCVVLGVALWLSSSYVLANFVEAQGRSGYPPLPCTQQCTKFSCNRLYACRLYITNFSCIQADLTVELMSHPRGVAVLFG